MGAKGGRSIRKGVVSVQVAGLASLEEFPSESIARGGSKREKREEGGQKGY